MSDPKNERKHDGEDEVEPIKVTDRRHWAREEGEEPEESAEKPTSAYPTMIDEFRERAETAERKLLEYIEAYKRAQQEHEQARQRLNRDVDRRVELKFGDLLTDLLATVDDLDLALSHVADVPEARALADGVAMVRDRFLSVLQRHGVEEIRPDGTDFDPNLAEAMQMEPVVDDERNGKVTRTLRPGYRLGDHVIRPARVAVGKSS